MTYVSAEPGHALVGLRRTTDPGRPIAVCTCGARASGAPGARWLVVDLGDGTARLEAAPPSTASLDWPGHFHAVVARAPWLS